MISAIVNTCNEESCLERCLESLKWADEIVIIDMHSTDKSVEIARRYTDKIYFHPKVRSVLYARDFSLTKASGDWILIVDPDEIVPSGLADKLKELAASGGDFSAVSFPRNTIFLGKVLKHAEPIVWKTRFLKKGAASFPKRVHSEPVINGKIRLLPAEEKYTCVHYMTASISAFIDTMNRYTSDEAEHMYNDDKIRAGKWLLIEKPLAEFKNRYFARRGYKDGAVGLVFSILMAVYRFTVYAKIWELENKRQ